MFCSFSIYSRRALWRVCELDDGLGITVHLTIEVLNLNKNYTHGAILSKIRLVLGLHWYITFCVFLIGGHHQHLSLTSIISMILERSLMNTMSSLILKYNFPCLELLVKDHLKLHTTLEYAPFSNNRDNTLNLSDLLGWAVYNDILYASI